MTRARSMPAKAPASAPTTAAKPTTSRPAHTAASVKELMFTKAASSALDPSHIKKLKLEPTLDVSKLPGMGKFPAKIGMKIPYFGTNGKMISFCRVRYLEDTRTGFRALTSAKPLRYVQPPSSTVHCYFPPLVDWSAITKDTAQPLFITEGELKAACLSAHGYPCLGLGGVWSWRSSNANTTLIPDLKEFLWSDRLVYICYDSDAVTNPKVMQAEVALADRLTEEGAVVYIVRIAAPDSAFTPYEPEKSITDQPGAPVSVKGEKLGVDDLIHKYGVDAFTDCLWENDGEGSTVRGAYAYSASYELHQFNTRYLFILKNNAVYDIENSLVHQATAFVNTIAANVYYDVQVPSKEEGKPPRTVRRPLAPAWIKWPGRADVKSLTFEPGESLVYRGSLNTWQGWNFDHPEKGDISPWTKLLDRVFAGADKADRQWFERWAAWPIRNPGAKMHTGVLIWGHQHGTGKSLIGLILSKMYHPDHSTVLTEQSLDDARNQWARDKQFVVADDITGRENREYANRLKNLVTQPKITIDPKYISSYDLRDCINYYLTSNDSDALLLSPLDRRFFVHGVIGKERLPETFGRAVAEWIGTLEGRRALYHYFLTLDMGDFDPNAPAPITDAKASMIETTRSDIGNWVTQLQEFPELILDQAKFVGDLYTAEKLYALYDPAGEKKSSPRVLTRELQAQGFRRASATGLAIPGEGRRHAYIVRNADKWDGVDNKKLIAEYLRGNPQVASKLKKY